jgi:hypothetical protein
VREIESLSLCERPAHPPANFDLGTAARLQHAAESFDGSSRGSIPSGIPTPAG